MKTIGRMRLVNNVLLSIMAVCFMLPMVWMLLASLDPQAQLSVRLPDTWSLSNFVAILNVDTTFRPLLNSLILSLGAAVVTVVVSVLAAYPLSRHRSKFNRPFMYGILFGTGLPITAMMVPVYSLFVKLNLLNSVPATILFMAATSLPMAIWMTKNFIDDIPISLEEAAWMDGTGLLKTLWFVVTPLMKPGLMVVFIFVFVGAWGNFFVPFVLLTSPANQPAAVSIYSFFGQYGAVAYGQLAAFSLIYSLPVVLLYVLVQRMTGGFSIAGGVKG